MKFLWQQMEWSSSVALAAIPDEHLDAFPPVSHLIMDASVGNLQVQKRIVAGILAFGSFVGGTVDGGKPVSRLLAQAITEYFPERYIVAESITDVPERAWPASGRLHVAYGDTPVDDVRHSIDLPHDYVVRLLDSTTTMGATATSHEILMATNADALVRHSPKMFNKALLAVAVALLHTDDLHAQTIRFVGQGDVTSLVRAAALVRATGVNLTWDLTG